MESSTSNALKARGTPVSEMTGHTYKEDFDHDAVTNQYSVIKGECVVRFNLVLRQHKRMCLTFATLNMDAL